MIPAPAPPRGDLTLGIDPGTAATGYGVVGTGPRGNPVLVECGVIRTSAQQSLATRLRDIHEGICELIARHQPRTLAVESIFYARNVRTTVVLGHTRGVILLAGASAQLDIVELSPAEIKKAIVGRGAATKEQVQFMVAQLLRLKAPPQPSDAADGVAAALCAMMAPRLSAELSFGTSRASA